MQIVTQQSVMGLENKLPGVADAAGPWNTVNGKVFTVFLKMCSLYHLTLNHH